MRQANLNFLDRSATKNLMQSGSINRFVKDPSQRIMHFKGMMYDFVCNLAKLFLRKVPKWDGCGDGHEFEVGKNMSGQKNVSLQNLLPSFPYHSSQTFFAPTSFCPFPLRFRPRCRPTYVLAQLTHQWACEFFKRKRRRSARRPHGSVRMGG
jgi:hypothetical protein